MSITSPNPYLVSKVVRYLNDVPHCAPARRRRLLLLLLVVDAATGVVAAAAVAAQSQLVAVHKL